MSTRQEARPGYQEPEPCLVGDETQADTVATPHADPLLGQTVGSYHVLARVGGGGMGVVYRARDTKLGRTVALKFLPAQWSHDDDARQRFVREAQAASATNHQNICTIHDIESAPDGQLFIVMAYYEGQTLKQRLASGPLPVDEALDIATQVADGLAKAHAQGVVHRDVKPGNVMVTEDGVRVLDFGLATFADALKLTVEHSTLGTAAYMSPEQVRGQSADARSDVWAVGIILYEMLKGHVPFRGSHAEAIAHAVRNETPEPLRAERPEIPEEVEQLVFRAIHKDPSVRFKDGREVARALRQVRGQSLPLDLRTQPVALPGPKPVSARTRRLTRKFWVAASTALVVMVAVASIWLTWPVDRMSIVVAPFGNQTGDTDLDPYRLALTQTLTASLGDSRDLHVVPYASVLEVLRRFLREGADVSNRDVLQAITVHTGADLLVVPTLLREGAAWRARVELRDPRTANSVWEHETSSETSSLTRDVSHRLALVLSADIDGHLKRPRTKVLDALSWLTPNGRRERPGTMGSLDAAKAFTDGTAHYNDLEYARAGRAFQTAVGLDPRNPLLLAWLSRAALLTKDDAQARETADRAVSLLTPQTSPTDALFVHAVAAEARRDTPAADRAYRELAAEQPDEPAWAIELGGFLDRQAKRVEAVAAYHRALMLDSRLLRPRLELCRLYNPARLNEPAEARTHGEAALAGYGTLGARGGEGQSRLCLVDILTLGKDDERKQARVYAEEARQIFDELHYDYNLARAEYYLGYVAATQGQLAESIAWGEKALARARDAGNLVTTAETLINLGAAHVALGDWERGLNYYEQAYPIYQSWRDESRAAQVQANRGALLIEHGNSPQGILDVKNALQVFERLGDRRFQTFSLRAIATYHRYQGQLQDATRELNKGLAIARERNLTDSATVMTTMLAQTQFDDGDYESARRSLVEVLKGATGRRSTEARIHLARTYMRLGDLAAADADLGIAERELNASPNSALRSLYWLVRGEWSLDSNRPRDARASFEKASIPWIALLPEPTAVEARAQLGFLNALDGRIDESHQMLHSSVDAARKLAHRSLAARCHLLLAEAEIVRGRLREAADALNAIAADDATGTIGPELRAQVHSVWSRLYNARGDLEAARRSADAARASIRSLMERIPSDKRAAFEARPLVDRLAH